MSDDCEVVTFNEAIPGSCIGDGRTTFQDFLAQMAANGNQPNRAVKDWDFSRTKTDIDRGGTVTVSNEGGEFHTFTKVAKFGGGCIQFLDDILGLTPVPECTPLAADGVTPQAFLNSGLPPVPGLTLPVTLQKPGVYKFQCLIHPWMQTTVTVKR
jgi:plastocyanin